MREKAKPCACSLGVFSVWRDFIRIGLLQMNFVARKAEDARHAEESAYHGEQYADDGYAATCYDIHFQINVLLECCVPLEQDLQGSRE